MKGYYKRREAAKQHLIKEFQSAIDLSEKRKLDINDNYKIITHHKPIKEARVVMEWGMALINYFDKDLYDAKTGKTLAKISKEALLEVYRKYDNHLALMVSFL